MGKFIAHAHACLVKYLVSRSFLYRITCIHATLDMRKYLLGLVVPLAVAIALLHVASRAKASETEELNSCPVSGGDLEDELESAFHDATEVIINCISVDEADGVRNGVVSVFYMEINNASSMRTSARFSLECTGSLLKILPSERPATNATVSCAEECAVEEEQDNLCPTGIRNSLFSSSASILCCMR